MRRLLCIICFELMLAGCGGGSESSPSSVSEPGTPTAEPVINVPQALANFVSTGYDLPVTMTAARFAIDFGEIVGYDTSTGRASASPAVASSFCTNDTPPRCTATWQVFEQRERGSDTLEFTPVRVEYSADTYAILLTEWDLLTGGSPFYFVYAPHTWPDTVKAGDAGDLRIGYDYTVHYHTKPLPPIYEVPRFAGRVIVTYRVASDTATSLLVTFDETLIELGGNGSDVVKTRSVYRVTTAGIMTPVEVFVERTEFGILIRQVTYTF